MLPINIHSITSQHDQHITQNKQYKQHNAIPTASGHHEGYEGHESVFHVPYAVCAATGRNMITPAREAAKLETRVAVSQAKAEKEIETKGLVMVIKKELLAARNYSCDTMCNIVKTKMLNYVRKTCLY